jgi:KRAB domain-containing zinc finger protein
MHLWNPDPELEGNQKPVAGSKPKPNVIQNQEQERAQLLVHISNGEKAFGCPTCQKVFRTAFNLRRHELTHTKEKPFQCNLCNKTYGLKASLKVHILTHAKEKPYPCHECGKRFTRKSNLISHARHEHPVEEDEERKNKIVPNELSTLACAECGMMFKTQLHLKYHISVVHKRPEEAFGCHICQKTFSYKRNLKRHELTHTTEKPFSCPEPECGMKFKLEHFFKYHLSFHRRGIDLTCPICNKRFHTSFHLKRHEARHANAIVSVDKTDGKPFMCLKCGKLFSRSATLRMHEKAHHLGIREHACTACDKRFTQKVNLTRHIQRIHSNSTTTENPGLRRRGRPAQQQTSFPCLECGKLYSRKTSLKLHEKIHLGIKDYACHYCDKAFRIKAHMVKHVRTHEKRVLLCGICHRKFQDEDLLLAHVTSHRRKRLGGTQGQGQTNKKCSTCRDCGKSFHFSSSLSRHRRTCYNYKYKSGKAGAKDAADDEAKALEIQPEKSDFETPINFL